MKNYLHESWTFNKPAMELHDFKIRFQTAQDIFRELDKLLLENDCISITWDGKDKYYEKIKQKYTGDKK